jgi:hypothetical protein
LLVAVHAERAGEFVGDAEGLEAGGFVEGACCGGGTELVEEIEAFADGGKVFLPELGKDIVDLIGCVLFCGHRGRLVLPAEDLGDLLGEGEGIKGFEEDSGEAEAGEAALIDSLDLCGEQKDGDVGDGGVFPHGFEGGGAIDPRHHDIHEDGVGLLGSGDGDAFCAGAGGEDVPAGCRFEREGRDLTNVIFVVNDQNASHERTYSLM